MNGLEAFSPTPVENGNNRSSDEPVAELENLKQILQGVPKQLENAKEVSVSKSSSSVFSDVNGRRSEHKERQDKVTKDGELVAKVIQKTELNKEKDTPARSRSRVEYEIPSEGVHKTFENDGDQEEVLEQLEGMNKLNALAGIEYSPLDMAEYVFWTGDEKGVALAIEDFLQEGLMTRQDAINFLQSIKANIENIQAHYQGLMKMEEKIATKIEQQMKTDSSSYEAKLRSGALDFFQSKSVPYESEIMKSLAQEALEKKQKRLQPTVVEGEDYDELFDKLKGAETLYNDYTLEEVIYELAKVMFSQSLSQGSKEAHNALKRFTEYLEKEVAYGQISRELEKKILGVLVAALSDTLGERPELLSAASEGLSNIGGTRSAFNRKHVLERRNLPKSSVDKSMKKHELQSMKNK